MLRSGSGIKAVDSCVGGRLAYWFAVNNNTVAAHFEIKKQRARSVWQAGPSWFTEVKMASASQSKRKETKPCVLPDVSPLRHSA